MAIKTGWSGRYYEDVVIEFKRTILVYKRAHAPPAAQLPAFLTGETDTGS